MNLQRFLRIMKSYGAILCEPNMLLQQQYVLQGMPKIKNIV